MTKTPLKTGTYRHFRGKEYEVYGVVNHSETEETLVLYRPLYGKQALWVRPMNLFTDSVRVNDEYIPRFSLVQEKPMHDGAFSLSP